MNLKEYLLALYTIEENLQSIFDEIEIFCKPFGEICTKENEIYGFSLDDKKNIKR